MFLYIFIKYIRNFWVTLINNKKKTITNSKQSKQIYLMFVEKSRKGSPTCYNLAWSSKLFRLVMRFYNRKVTIVLLQKLASYYTEHLLTFSTWIFVARLLLFASLILLLLFFSEAYWLLFWPRFSKCSHVEAFNLIRKQRWRICVLIHKIKLL